MPAQRDSRGRFIKGSGGGASGALVDVSEVQAEIAGIEARVTDLSPLTAEIAEVLVGAVNDRWRSGGDGEWPGLAASTLAKRRKGGVGAQILQDSGRSIASVHGDSGPTWAEAATDVATMIYHVSDQPRSRIPLRDPFDVYDAVSDEIADMVASYVAGE